MIALRTRRHRSTAPLAVLLLVLQGLAGGAVPLAHASERFTTPPHVEAQHSSTCLPLHDALRCALCHYALTRVVPQPLRAQPAAAASAQRRPEQAAVVRTGGLRHLSSPPRAPPGSPS